MANILAKQENYNYWRDQKLANANTKIEDCLVDIEQPNQLSSAEKKQIQHLCQRNNFALFNIAPTDNYPQTIANINAQFGLKQYDEHLYVKDHGLAHITQSNKKKQSEFIPYTDKAIGWHTDGYYNAPEHRIRSFSLFCVTPAETGGESQWLDQQMAYLLLREDNPDVAKALTHPQAMTIPAHMLDGVTRRKISVGPVFFIDEPTSQLYMRYTQRKKNIEFLDSTEIKQAIAILDDLLNTQSDYHFIHTMDANQGMLCNNALHKRSTFTDNVQQPRLLLRGRYFNRIN